jgi:membrane protease subunit (stomatin/prohibitin family)
MASQVHLTNTAGGFITVTPAAGVDFGTNQVAVLSEDAQQEQQHNQQHGQTQQQQQQRPGSSGSASSKGSSERTPGTPVVRELRVCNVHASRSVLLLNVCVVSAGLPSIVTGTWTSLLAGTSS